MAERSRAAVALFFSDGTSLDVFQSFSLRTSFVDPLGHLELTTTPPAAEYATYRQNLAKGQVVKLVINGVNQGNWLIQTADRKLGEKGRQIKITAHSLLITPYQGDVDPDYTFASQTDVPVEKVVLDILGPYGFTAIVTDAQAHASALSGRPIGGGAGPITATLLKHQDMQAHEGEAAYAATARIYTRLGCALHVDSDGHLLLAAPDYDQDEAYTLIRSTQANVDGDYFVGDVDVHDSNNEQFSQVTVRGMRDDQEGQTSTQRPVATVATGVTTARRAAYNSAAAPYKPKWVKDPSSRDVQRATNVATFEIGMRAAQSYWVKGTVDGWVSTTGRIWTPNTMARLIVEEEEIDEAFYLLEVLLTETEKDGQRARLQLIERGALVLGTLPT